MKDLKVPLLAKLIGHASGTSDDKFNETYLEKLGSEFNFNYLDDLLEIFSSEISPSITLSQISRDLSKLELEK